MQNFVLGYQDIIQYCTLSSSGLTFNTSFPREMMQDQLITGVAKTTGDGSALTINILVPSGMETDLETMGIINHNFDGGTYQWIARTDSFSGTIRYNSTALTMPTFNSDVNYKTIVTTGVPSQSCRYWQLIVTNTSNADGILKIGRLFLGKRFNPDRNMDYGMQMGVLDQSTEITSAANGIEFYRRYPTKRYANFSMSLIDYTTSDEHFKMSMIDGVAGAILFEFDPDNYKGGLYSYIGRMSQLNPLEFPSYNLNDYRINIREII